MSVTVTLIVIVHTAIGIRQILAQVNGLIAVNAAKKG